MNNISLILKGRPYTKKTSNRVVPVWGKDRRIVGHKVLPSENYVQYEKDCLPQIARQRAYDLKIDCPVAVTARYFMKDRQAWPDLTGLMQATADILQAAGVIVNDRQIVSWDGSRIGIDKYNPRAEVSVYAMPDTEQGELFTGEGAK